MQSQGGNNPGTPAEPEYCRGMEAKGDGRGFSAGDEERSTSEHESTVDLKELKRRYKRAVEHVVKKEGGL